MNELLAAVSASALAGVLIQVLVAGLICWLLWWLIAFVAPPEPFNKFARGIVAIIAVIFLINALLTIAGRPFITF